jgi:hypothetical protein
VLSAEVSICFIRRFLMHLNNRRNTNTFCNFSQVLSQYGVSRWTHPVSTPAGFLPVLAFVCFISWYDKVWQSVSHSSSVKPEPIFLVDKLFNTSQAATVFFPYPSQIVVHDWYIELLFLVYCFGDGDRPYFQRYWCDVPPIAIRKPEYFSILLNVADMTLCCIRMPHHLS